MLSFTCSAWFCSINTNCFNFVYWPFSSLLGVLILLYDLSVYEILVNESDQNKKFLLINKRNACDSFVETIIEKDFFFYFEKEKSNLFYIQKCILSLHKKCSWRANKKIKLKINWKEESKKSMENKLKKKNR